MGRTRRIKIRHKEVLRVQEKRRELRESLRKPSNKAEQAGKSLTYICCENTDVPLSLYDEIEYRVVSRETIHTPSSLVELGVVVRIPESSYLYNSVHDFMLNVSIVANRAVLRLDGLVYEVVRAFKMTEAPEYMEIPLIQGSVHRVQLSDERHCIELHLRREAHDSV